MNDNNLFSKIKAEQEKEKTEKELSLRKLLEFLNSEVAQFQNIIVEVLDQYANELLTDGTIEYSPPAIKDKVIKSPYWVAYNKSEPQKPIWIGLFIENDNYEWPATGFWVKASKSSIEYTNLSKQSLIEAVTKLYNSYYRDK